MSKFGRTVKVVVAGQAAIFLNIMPLVGVVLGVTLLGEDFAFREAFGAVEGTLLCLIGTTAGSMIIYFFVRRFGVRAVEIFFSREKIESLHFLRSEHKRNTLMFLLMLIPGTPKDLLCYFAPLTGMGPWTWLWITTVARIPSIVTSTIGGSALGVQNYVFAAIALGVTLLISGAGLLIYRRICRALEKRSGED